MTFTFSFDVGNTEIATKGDLTSLNVEIERMIEHPDQNEKLTGVPCYEVLDSPSNDFRMNFFKEHLFNEIVYKQPTPLDGETANSSSLLERRLIDEESDLIPGRYEGGFKIWECSLDLAAIVSKSPNIYFQPPKKVLELGCGHGVPGIVAMMAFEDDVEEIVFTDFNGEVLQKATWPSIKLNVNHDVLNKVRCIAGNWSSLSTLVDKFDLILSAETLYTRESCQRVFEIVQAHLQPDGVALIASKKYYFGVGGGTYELENLAKRSKSTLRYTLIKSYDDGQSNIREPYIIATQTGFDCNMVAQA